MIDLEAIRQRNEERKAMVAEIEAINDHAERNVGRGYRPLVVLGDKDAKIIADIDALLEEVERLLANLALFRRMDDARTEVVKRSRIIGDVLQDIPCLDRTWRE
jgi:hypothetical protein